MKNKYNSYLYIFVTIIIVSIFILITISCKKKENFENPEIMNDNIKMYVITLRQEQRMENIKKQENKIDKKIEAFDAVKGDLLNVDELIQNGVLSESYKNAEKVTKREIGCYMSHINLYKLIKETNKLGYTLIFEDDFHIEVDDFMNKLKDSIKKIQNVDFDLLYLGNHNDNHGELIIDNIYKSNNNESLIGTHSYLVNNKKIDKIINSTKYMDAPIDIKIQDLSRRNELNVLVIYPSIVTQKGSQYSSIRDLTVSQ
jgi:GR25 family glycosyltransferase involved in LPS biosynthesis